MNRNASVLKFYVKFQASARRSSTNDVSAQDQLDEKDLIRCTFPENIVYEERNRFYIKHFNWKNFVTQEQLRQDLFYYGGKFKGFLDI